MKNLESTIEFIINQQAQFSADIQAMKDVQRSMQAQQQALLDNQEASQKDIRSLVDVSIEPGSSA